jgi:uncharacterized membrane protein YeaQ/YmgE (transglycosylase-associated protein family)
MSFLGLFGNKSTTDSVGGLAGANAGAKTGSKKGAGALSIIDSLMGATGAFFNWKASTAQEQSGKSNAIFNAYTIQQQKELEAQRMQAESKKWTFIAIIFVLLVVGTITGIIAYKKLK